MYLLTNKTKNDIIHFLNEVKEVTNSNFIFLQRNELNKDPNYFIGKIEYDLIDVIEEIKKLTYKDYLKCQIDSINGFLFMYVFIKTIKKYVVYIKLSIVKKNDKKVYVISFHEAVFNELNHRPFKDD